MIEGGIKIVDAERIHTQFLHEDCISQADIGIGEGILAVLRLVSPLTSRLVVDADDHKALASSSLDQVAATDLDGVDSMSNIGAEGWKQQSCASKLRKLMVSNAKTAGNTGGCCAREMGYLREPYQ